MTRVILINLFKFFFVLTKIDLLHSFPDTDQQKGSDTYVGHIFSLKKKETQNKRTISYSLQTARATFYGKTSDATWAVA